MKALLDGRVEWVLSWQAAASARRQQLQLIILSIQFGSFGGTLHLVVLNRTENEWCAAVALYYVSTVRLLSALGIVDIVHLDWSAWVSQTNRNYEQKIYPLNRECKILLQFCINPQIQISISCKKHVQHIDVASLPDSHAKQKNTIVQTHDIFANRSTPLEVQPTHHVHVE